MLFPLYKSLSPKKWDGMQQSLEGAPLSRVQPPQLSYEKGRQFADEIGGCNASQSAMTPHRIPQFNLITVTRQHGGPTLSFSPSPSPSWLSVSLTLPRVTR